MKKKHILVVDDVRLNLRCAEDVLKDQYRLTMASSGKQALEILEKEVPDLILLDIIMPDMDGYEVFGKIRQMPGLTNVPIIFLTADTGVESEVMGFQMGAMDYIHKPFNPDVMRCRVKRVIESEDMKRLLEMMAKKDVLTGLWNRSYLQKVVNFTGEQGGKGVLVLFDMDNFKSVNDNFGHLIGDAVLSRFAESLLYKMKVNDVACRLGGDEFAVFFNDSCTKNEFDVFMREWMQELWDAVKVVKGEETGISVSAGIAGMPTDGTDFVTLYNKADKALYNAKNNGKNTYRFYQEKENFDFEISKQVDIEQIQERITDKKGYKGAFQLEYAGFTQICHFIQRSVERSKQKVQMVLFSVRAREGMEQNPENTGKLLRLLEDTIINSLRKADVANRYNNSQYVILLLDANLSDGGKVAERVINKCQSEFMENGYEIVYDIETLKKATVE